MIKSVCDHVALFQPVESHYTRKNCSKLYLSNDLNMNKMFALYKEWDQLVSYDNKATTLRQYRDVNQHMKIEFLTPKKDLCDKCHFSNNENSLREDQIQACHKHIENKNVVRELKNTDKESASSSPEIVCAIFNFQKILNAKTKTVRFQFLIWLAKRGSVTWVQRTLPREELMKLSVV